MFNTIKIPQLFKTSIFVVILLLSSIVFTQLTNLPEIKTLIAIIQAHFIIYVLALIIMKSLSIIYPPLPGTILTLASVPLIGWQLAFGVDILGGLIGVTASFWLSQKFGAPLLEFILGNKLANKLLSIKLKNRNQIESAMVLRIASGGLFSDGIAWGASLIGFRLLPFLIGYLISHLITTLPVFYFLGISIEFNSWLIVGGVVIFAWFVIYKFKGRYFE